MTQPKTHLQLTIREGRAVKIMVVEADDQATDDQPSSSRIKAAHPTSAEFIALKAWNESAKSKRSA